MRLSIEWFTKISSADIRFDGLTVIAEKSNTGKGDIARLIRRGIH